MAHSLTIPTRQEAIKAHRATGGDIAAILPIHYPRALFRAFGLLPVEVWGPPGKDTTSGDAHLQAYTCSIVRCSLSFVLDGGLDDVAAFCIPHACDSLQGLASLLMDFVPQGKPVLPIYLPRGRRPADTEFLAQEFRSIHQKLCQATGNSPSPELLSECIAREEQADRVLAQLFEQRLSLPMNNRSFYELVRAREYVPAEMFSALAQEALALPADQPQSGVPIILSGLTPEPMTVLDALDDAQMVVAADYLACAGRRLYPASQEKDPFRRMADSIMGGPADPTRGCSIAKVRAHLLHLARRSKAKGVIHFEIKFCEPEQFYLPLVNQGLDQAGLRNLSLEVDIADPLPDQLVTRLEAFGEILS